MDPKTLFYDALPLWSPGVAIIILLVSFQLIKRAKGNTSLRANLSTATVACVAYSIICLAITLAKQHLFEASFFLALALAALAGTSFLVAAYFERLRVFSQAAGVILVVTAASSSYGNWLPQFNGGYPTPEVKLTIDQMTPQQLADEGETIIFGGIGQSRVLGAIGRGQCPLCHTFFAEAISERAPNLWGITARKRLKDSSIEYIAESHVCPSCYVVGGYGVRGTENGESPMPAIHKPPISLSIDDFIAVDTWLFWHEGEIPPSPEEIRTVYEALIPPHERPQPYTDQKPLHEYGFLLADGSEPVDQIFAKAQCVVCHTIPGIAGASGTTGPRLAMKTQAPARMKDKNYNGKARSVREYVTESILQPSVYVTRGYPDNLMPRVYGRKLNGLAIDKMVDYLAEVEEGKRPPPIR